MTFIRINALLRKYFFRFQGQNLKTQQRFMSQGVQAEKSQRQIPRERPAIRKRGQGSGYPLLIIPLTTFGLGTWQIQRREWKLNLIKELEDKMTRAPVPLPQNLEDVKDMEYCRVKVRGTFDHSRELFIGPRSNVYDEVAGSNRAATVGVNVVTPFKLADREETILVNRGHVPFKDRPPAMRAAGQVEGEVELVGVVRLNEKKSMFANDPLKDGYWMHRDIDEMAEIAGTSTVYIDADYNSSVRGGPYGGQTRVTLRNEHLTYIITWYSLTALLLFVWWRNYKKPVLHRTVLEQIKRDHKRM